MKSLPKNFIEQLKEYISFKSISTDDIFKPELEKTSQWIAQYLENHGFHIETIQGPRTNPIIIGTYIVDESLPTVLVYGHYDVQPAQQSDGWSSDPFVLTQKKDRLIGRGIVDNKGQNFIHLYTVCSLIQEGTLGKNVIFMIECNEETANPDIADLVKKYKHLLQADCIIVSDGEIVGNRPTLEASLRGGFNFTLKIHTAKNNLHSGLAGGAVPSASHELSRLIAKLYNNKNQVVIPGFYDNVELISSVLKKQNSLIQTETIIKKTMGVQKLLPENGYDFYTQIGLRPTIQVTGVHTGYTGVGYANIVPASAEARINVRLVANQNPKKVYQSIITWIKKEIPDYARLEIIPPVEMNDPIRIDLNTQDAQHALKLLKQVYKREPVIKYVGGGIPVISDFQKYLNKNILLISLGNDDCNMHGVDENFNISLIQKGLDFSKRFFEK